MTRFGVFLAVALLAGTTSRGGELDSEYGRKGPVSLNPVKVALPAAMDEGLGNRTASELDGEAPAQSWRHGYHGYGGFGRFGYGGFGRFGYGGFGRFGGFGYPRFWGYPG